MEIKPSIGCHVRLHTQKAQIQFLIHVQMALLQWSKI